MITDSDLYEEVAVGDKVFVSFTRPARYVIASVIRLTKTQIVTDAGKYRKVTGYEVGSDEWNLSTLHVATEENVIQWGMYIDKKRNINLVRSINDLLTNDISTELLKSIKEMIENEMEN